MTFRRAASTEDFSSGNVRKVEIDGSQIMIIRLGDSFHALDSTCTHEDADLSRGILSGNSIVCPLHLSRFNVETGDVENPPATEPLRTYSVRVDGNEIYVDV